MQLSSYQSSKIVSQHADAAISLCVVQEEAAALPHREVLFDKPFNISVADLLPSSKGAIDIVHVTAASSLPHWEVFLEKSFNNLVTDLTPLDIFFLFDLIGGSLLVLFDDGMVVYDEVVDSICLSKSEASMAILAASSLGLDGFMGTCV